MSNAKANQIKSNIKKWSASKNNKGSEYILDEVKK